MSNGQRLVLEALMQAERRAVQQNRTDDDCAIAATANLLGIPYEQASAAFGRPVDPIGGMPSSVDGKEPTIADVSRVIDSLGHPNQLVFGPDGAQFASWFPGTPVAATEQLRSVLDGRSGVVMERDKDDEGHCLVWKGNAMVDPRAPYRRVDDWNTLNIVGAVVLK